jgi:hypothetical protein
MNQAHFDYKDRRFAGKFASVIWGEVANGYAGIEKNGCEKLNVPLRSKKLLCRVGVHIPAQIARGRFVHDRSDA